MCYVNHILIILKYMLYTLLCIFGFYIIYLIISQYIFIGRAV